MAWDAGMASGASSGLARESAWKPRDREALMHQQTSQLDQLIGQINVNTQMKYRRERDAITDDQWAQTQALRVNADKRAAAAAVRDEERHDVIIEESEYQKGRRPFREKVAEDTYRWRKEGHEMEKETHADTLKTNELQRKHWQRENEHNYGKPGLFGDKVGDAIRGITGKSWLRHIPGYDALAGTKGYKDLLREEAALKIRLLREKRDYENSPEYKKIQAEKRDLERRLTESQIDENKARAWALENPQKTAPKVGKFLSNTEARNIGLNSPILKNIARDMGGFPWFGHNIMEWQSGKKPSMSRNLVTGGRQIGASLRRQIPIGLPANELEQAIAAIWQGVLMQEGDEGNLTRWLTFDIDKKDTYKRMSDAYGLFRNGVLAGLGLQNNRQDFVDKILDSESGNDVGGGNIDRVDTSWWKPGLIDPRPFVDPRYKPRRNPQDLFDPKNIPHRAFPRR